MKGSVRVADHAAKGFVQVDETPVAKHAEIHHAPIRSQKDLTLVRHQIVGDGNGTAIKFLFQIRTQLDALGLVGLMLFDHPTHLESQLQSNADRGWEGRARQFQGRIGIVDQQLVSVRPLEGDEHVFAFATGQMTVKRHTRGTLLVVEVHQRRHQGDPIDDRRVLLEIGRMDLEGRGRQDHRACFVGLSDAPIAPQDEIVRLRIRQRREIDAGIG